MTVVNNLLIVAKPQQLDSELKESAKFRREIDFWSVGTKSKLKLHDCTDQMQDQNFFSFSKFY